MSLDPSFRPTKTTRPAPSGGNSGGTFTPGGFVPKKAQVIAPPDQAPYRHGKSPGQVKAKALEGSGEVKVTTPVSHSDVQRAAQTKAMQRMLNGKGAHLSVDGQWGPETEAAYQAYLHHSAQQARTSQHFDASRVPGYMNSPTPQSVHEALLLEREARLRALQPHAVPGQTKFSTIKRYAPHYGNEPIAGYEGMLRNPDGSWAEPGTRAQPGARPANRAYYTDANTHESTRGQVASANDTTQFEAMFGPQTTADVNAASKDVNPAVGGVIEGAAGLIPGVMVGKKLARGQHISGGDIAGEAVNDIAYLGAAPFKIIGGVVAAAAHGEDIVQTARAAVKAIKEERIAHIDAPIIKRDIASSPERQQFINALAQTPNLTNPERNALIQVADHRAVQAAEKSGAKPSEEWGKANFVSSQYHDVEPTAAEAGALAQDGHFQQQHLSQQLIEGKHPFPPMDVQRTQPFYSKLYTLVHSLPPKITPQEFLGKVKSAAIKDDEMKWSGINKFVENAKEQGVKHLSKEEMLAWLDNNYLQVEENRRFEPRDSDPYSSQSNSVNSDLTKFSTYSLPGGPESNYQEFTIRMPEEKYGQLYSYTGHFPDSNILAHVRTTDRLVNGDHTLMIEEIQSDLHQAGQKQGYRVPIEEHPEYKATVEAAHAATVKAQPIKDNLRRLITESLFNHPELPGMPPILHQQGLKEGEHMLGFGSFDTMSRNDLADLSIRLEKIDNAAIAADEAGLEPRAYVKDLTPSEANLRGYGAKLGFEARVGEVTIDRRVLQSYETHRVDWAREEMQTAVHNINSFLMLPEHVQDEIRQGVSDLQEALYEKFAADNKLRHIENESMRGIPDFPFKKTWHELAFKRMLAEAVDKGYDRVAWTTGRTQAERYQLANFFKRIELETGHSGGDVWEWAREMADSAMESIDDEQLGLDYYVEQELRDRAEQNVNVSYPTEEEYMITDPETGFETLDQEAYDEAMQEYTDEVDRAYEDVLDNWRESAMESYRESETEYYVDNASEYDYRGEGNILVKAWNHEGRMSEYEASDYHSGDENALENVIGPDLAKAYDEHGETEFEGDNLVAGDNAKSALGAAHFYDNKLTGFVNKYLKKAGVQSTIDEIGKASGPFKLRVELRPGGSSWTLEGRGDYPIGNYFDALAKQHKEFGDIPRPVVESKDGEVWVHWDGFPQDAKVGVWPQTGEQNSPTHGRFIKGWGGTKWGPYTDYEDAWKSVEDNLIRNERDYDWANVKSAGTVVHSIPVNDAVRAFVEPGQALFQRDPLVRTIKDAQTIKGAVTLADKGGELHLFKKADASTVVHELGHVVQNAIPEVRNIHPERFARGFEKYVMTHDAPSEALAPAWKRLSDSLHAIYFDGVPKAGRPLTANMQKAIGKYLAGSGESSANEILAGTHMQASFSDDKKPEPKADGFPRNNGDLKALQERGALPNETPARGGAEPPPGESTYTPNLRPEDEGVTHFQEDELARDESLANTYQPETDKSPEEVIREGMKGVQVRRGAQEALRSEERAKRAAAFAERLKTADGLEGFREATKALRGEYPKIDFHGFTELNPEALHYAINTVRDHPTLLPFQKLNLVEALDAATKGKMPTAYEQKLIEHVFGKDTARGFVQISGWPKHLQELAAEVLNVPRSIMASFDLSAPFRQGLVAGVNHPMIFAKNFGPMLKAFGKERSYQAIMDEIKTRPTYPLMVHSKLAITDMEAVSDREEQFYSNLAERLTGGQKSPIRMSGRAYTAFLVKMRADVFDHLVQQAAAQGRDVHNDKFLRDLARFINSSTGRGPLYFLEHAAPTLNTLFFSPRLLASRLDLLLSPITYVRADPFARKQALLAALQTAGTAMTVLGLVSQIPGVKVGIDPRNADFGKIRVGDTRLDILGGFQQPIRLAAQLATSTVISSTTGRKMQLGTGKFGAMTQKDILERFFQTKLAPVPSIAYDKLQNKDFTGKKFSWKQEILQHMSPLLAQDAADLYTKPVGGINGVAAAVGGYAVGSVGFGLQTYSAKNAGGSASSRLEKQAKAIGFEKPPKDILIEVKTKSELDSLSQQNQGNPLKELNDVIDYYAKKTGDHEYDQYKDSKTMTEVEAQSAVAQLRARLIGPGLSEYESALKSAYKSQGKVPKP